MTAAIAFFDVDGTVVRGRMVMQAIRYLIARRELSYADLARGGFYSVLHYLDLMDYESVFRQAAAPFVAVLFVFLIIVTYVPWLSTAIPYALMGPEIITR